MGRRAGSWEISMASQKPLYCGLLHLHSLPWSAVLSILAGYHPFAVVSLQLASSSTGGGRRTGWAVWEGHFSLACRFPVSKLSLQGPGCYACEQHCRGLGEAGAGLLLATSPCQRAWRLQDRVSASHTGSAEVPGSNGSRRFPSPTCSLTQRNGDIRAARAAWSAAPRQWVLQL